MLSNSVPSSVLSSVLSPSKGLSKGLSPGLNSVLSPSKGLSKGGLEKNNYHTNQRFNHRSRHLPNLRTRDFRESNQAIKAPHQQMRSTCKVARRSPRCRDDCKADRRLAPLPPPQREDGRGESAAEGGAGVREHEPT